MAWTALNMLLLSLSPSCSPVTSFFTSLCPSLSLSLSHTSNPSYTFFFTLVLLPWPLLMNSCMIICQTLLGHSHRMNPITVYYSNLSLSPSLSPVTWIRTRFLTLLLMLSAAFAHSLRCKYDTRTCKHRQANTNTPPDREGNCISRCLANTKCCHSRCWQLEHKAVWCASVLSVCLYRLLCVCSQSVWCVLFRGLG